MLAVGVFGALALAVSARGADVVVTSTIQAAVDAAHPGDRVMVPPGIYHESVLVNKDDLTIVGSRNAVLDASGFENGIRVGTGAIGDVNGVPVCPPVTVHKFTIEGLTIRNAGENGLFLIGVEGFRLRGGAYVDNAEYGPFPVCSRNGLIERNSVEGGTDAGIYVGDDDQVVVERNSVTSQVIGVEIENSTNAVVRQNTLFGDTIGVLVVVLPGLPQPFTDHVLVDRNVIVRNNLQNPIAPDSGDDVGLIPTGTGILNVGGDNVTFSDNRVIGNNSAGIAIIADPFAAFDPRIEPFPDGNAVRGNTILRNGLSPDPLRAPTPGADIVYDGSGTGNCFADNVFATEFPPGITEQFPCT